MPSGKPPTSRENLIHLLMQEKEEQFVEVKNYRFARGGLIEDVSHIETGVMRQQNNMFSISASVTFHMSASFSSPL